MKILIDFFPVIAFFIAYYIPDNLEQRIYIATIAAIIAAVIQVSLNWLINRRFEKMHLIVLLIILVLGGLTLWLQDKRFIMWKPSALSCSHLLVGRPATLRGRFRRTPATP